MAKKTLREQFQGATARQGKAHGTRVAKCSKLGILVDWLKSQNIQIKSTEHLKIKHIEAYAAHRLTEVKKSTFQNDLSALRTALREEGRHKLAEQISTRALGAHGAERMTKDAIPGGRFAALRAAVEQRDKGVAAVVDLERCLGLRRQEAIMSPKSLVTWEKALARGERFYVMFGTKNGRERWVDPVDKKAALEAVKAARAISDDQGGRMIVAQQKTLKSAEKRYDNVMRRSGFVGKESGHALRYTFTHNQLRHYWNQGFTKEECWARVSKDLGHSAERYRYIRDVYGKSFEFD